MPLQLYHMQYHILCCLVNNVEMYYDEPQNVITRYRANRSLNCLCVSVVYCPISIVSSLYIVMKFNNVQ